MTDGVLEILVRVSSDRREVSVLASLSSARRALLRQSGTHNNSR